VLAFLFVKDGPRFLPWVRTVAGDGAGGHVAEVLRRIWKTVGDFIRTQAAVALVDAVLIGAGLAFLGVPLALPLAVLTFLAGFVPIVGAIVAGALGVLVALVSNGVGTAVIVLVLIVAVQQIEGNVLQPMLQSRSLRLHAAVVLLAVTGGSTLYGIAGAFLSVPVVAASAGGSPLARSQAVGGHRTVARITARKTGNTTDHSAPTSHHSSVAPAATRMSRRLHRAVQVTPSPIAVPRPRTGRPLAVPGLSVTGARLSEIARPCRDGRPCAPDGAAPRSP
jgi:hypothetical protein